MPKKKKGGGASAKVQKKVTDRIIEDKTFGLKNKNKSKKVQRYVQQVQQQVKNRGKDQRSVRMQEEAARRKKTEKKMAEKMAAETAALFKAVAGSGGAGGRQTADGTVDPKSVLCAYFKAGHCRRGGKCKFSHDLNIGRKAAKINVYADPRQQDTMDSWDQAKLEKVVAEKHKRRSNETNIICKYFLDAIEQNKYGWFWQCPNGNNECIYKHALPPGYKLQQAVAEAKAADDDGPLLEDVIEAERAALDISTCTPVTPETFAKWKESKKKQKEEEVKKQIASVTKSSKSRTDGLSGRALFMFDPSLFVDDAEAEDEYEIQSDADDEDGDEAKTSGGPPDTATDTPDDGAGSGAPTASVAAAAAAVTDASLFLDDDDALPSDEDD